MAANGHVPPTVGNSRRIQRIQDNSRLSKYNQYRINVLPLWRWHFVGCRVLKINAEINRIHQSIQR